VKRVFFSDCEGPISKNDNAFELTVHFVPEGDKLFSLISKYDDVLADVVKKPGYSAGSTLKLVLPFLRAYNVTDKKMHEFSVQNLILIAGSKETLQHVMSIAEAFIVSTSYEHYIKALCETLDFPFQNTYCTKLTIDRYTLSAEDKAKLKETAKEIAAMPLLAIPFPAKSLKDLSSKDQETVKRLDNIFWKEIAGMSSGRIFSEVTTVGGEQKAHAIRDATAKLHVPLSNVMYVGDSITDVEAFKLVKDNGGLTLSFNGNSYAVKNAEVAVMSDNNIVTAVLADVFLRHGKEQVLQVAEEWNYDSLKRSAVNSTLLDRLFVLYPKALPKLQIVTKANMETLSTESSEFRKKVRGEAVGKLG
jgi:energy-converting hydrogenase A subunit R